MRLDVDVRSSNPPAPLLQAPVFPHNTKLLACNVMEGGYTEKHFMPQTHLTEPPGIIKNLQ